MRGRLVLIAAALSLAACSRDGGREPEVHETGAPTPLQAEPAAGPVVGVTQQGQTVVLDGDVLFLPGSTELAPGAEAAIAYAAQRIGAGEGPTVVVAGAGEDEARGLQLAQSTAEALSYIGGASFNRLEPRGVRDPSAGRRVTLTPQPAG